MARRTAGRGLFQANGSHGHTARGTKGELVIPTSRRPRQRRNVRNHGYGRKGQKNQQVSDSTRHIAQYMRRTEE